MRIEDKQELSEQDSIEQTLEACVLALARWKGTLSPDLHHNIQEVGKQLREKESAISELRGLLVNSELKNSYNLARRDLYQKYNARERSKGNASQPAGSLVLGLAVPILTADNFVAAARKLVTQPDWQAQVKRSSDDIQTFFRTLKDAVTSLDSLSVALLQILDRDVFTLDSLAYRLELPKAQVKPVLEDLWRQNYIRPLSRTVWGNLIGRLNIFTPKQGKLDTGNHYLGLTVKGYYFLHPHPVYRAIAKAK